MIETLRWLGILMVAAFRAQRDLALENLALRQQLGVLKRKGVPRLKPKGRVFWVVLSRVWPHWRKLVHLIKADTSSVGNGKASEFIGPGFQSGKVPAAAKSAPRS